MEGELHPLYAGVLDGHVAERSVRRYIMVRADKEPANALFAHGTSLLGFPRVYA